MPLLLLIFYLINDGVVSCRFFRICKLAWLFNIYFVLVKQELIFGMAGHSFLDPLLNYFFKAKEYNDQYACFCTVLLLELACCHGYVVLICPRPTAVLTATILLLLGRC